MKIVHTSHSPAFALRFAMPIVSFLKREGHEVELWTDAPARELKLLQKLPPETKFIRTSLCLNFFKWPLIFTKLYFELRQSRPDILHCHSTRGSLLPLLAGKWAGIKNRVYNNHGFPYLGHKGILRFLLLCIEKINISLATKVISVSESNREELLKDIKVEKEKVILLHKGSAIGIRLEDYPLSKKTDPEFRFLYIGRPFKRKGFHLMVEAWNKGKLAKTGAKLLIAGCTEEELQKLNQSTEGILALGFVTEINELIKSSDVVVLPSFHEGLPYALLEAQAFGKAVIGSNIPGIRSVIEDRKTGLLFELSSLESFINALQLIQKDHQLRERLGKNARLKIEEDFDQNLVFNDLVKLYRSLI